MLNALRTLFGLKVKEKAVEAPYKVEAPATAKKAAKKPTVKKATTRKPRAPKA